MIIGQGNMGENFNMNGEEPPEKPEGDNNTIPDMPNENGQMQNGDGETPPDMPNGENENITNESNN